MEQKILTRAQRRLLKCNQLQPNPLKQVVSNTKQDDESKEDDRKNDNNLTCHKIEQDKQNPKKLKPLTIYNNTSAIDRFHRYRRRIVNYFSQLQYCYKISMQSLFLATAIFDKYTDSMEKSGLFLEEKLLSIGIIAFRLAIKFQQIYPPSLSQIYNKLNTMIDLGDFVEVQTDILVKLQFNLAFPSPLTHLENFSFQMTQQKRTFIYLYLEIALFNIDIKNTYSWDQVIDAIKLMFQPADEILKQEKKKSKKIDCLKLLISERGKLSQCYYWLYMKYSAQSLYEISSIGSLAQNMKNSY